MHLDYLIVASSVIKWIAPFREVVHDVAWIKDGNPGAVVPRQAQRILYKERTGGIIHRVSIIKDLSINYAEI